MSGFRFAGKGDQKGEEPDTTYQHVENDNIFRTCTQDRSHPLCQPHSTEGTAVFKKHAERCYVRLQPAGKDGRTAHPCHANDSRGNAARDDSVLNAAMEELDVLPAADDAPNFATSNGDSGGSHTTCGTAGATTDDHEGAHNERRGWGDKGDVADVESRRTRSDAVE